MMTVEIIHRHEVTWPHPGLQHDGNNCSHKHHISTIEKNTPYIFLMHWSHHFSTPTFVVCANWKSP